MYPIVQIGPLNLGTGALLLLITVWVGVALLERIARARGGDTLAKQAENCYYAALLGAVLGGRLWYGLLNWDLYGTNPGLFFALRLNDLAWPGAFSGGALGVFLLARRHNYPLAAIGDCFALVLPVTQAITGIGLLLSGELLGQPTTLPWAISLFGTLRHPTQLYLSIAALASLALLWWLARRTPPAGTLLAIWAALQGLTLLLLEALRADALLLPGGIRAAQVFGFLLLLTALWWLSKPTKTTTVVES